MFKLTSHRELCLALALVTAACPTVDEPDDDDVVLDDDDASYEPTWTSLFPLLNFRCGCHRANEGGDGGLIGLEDEDRAYEALVGHPAEDLPGLSRIEPFDPESSYAWLKIQGEHRAAGGAGSRMPPTGNALPDAQKAVIRAWIEAGAPRD